MRQKKKTTGRVCAPTGANTEDGLQRLKHPREDKKQNLEICKTVEGKKRSRSVEGIAEIGACLAALTVSGSVIRCALASSCVAPRSFLRVQEFDSRLFRPPKKKNRRRQREIPAADTSAAFLCGCMCESSGGAAEGGGGGDRVCYACLLQLWSGGFLL